VVPITDDF